MRSHQIDKRSEHQALAAIDWTRPVRARGLWHRAGTLRVLAIDLAGLHPVALVDASGQIYRCDLAGRSSAYAERHQPLVEQVPQR